MQYYQIIGSDKIKRIVLAKSPTIALSSVSAGLNPTISELTNVDFSLYNKTYLNTYIIRSNGVRYFVSGNDQNSSLSTFLGKYGIEASANRMAVGYNFDLVFGNKKPIGWNVHFGDPNSDYVPEIMQKLIDDMLYAGFNSCRNGYFQIYGDNLFLPNGTKFDTWMDLCIANNITTMVNVSMSFAAIDPVVKTANWTNKVDSSGYTSSQYATIQSDGFAKGANFANRYKTKMPTWEGIILGSELDVIDTHTKKIGTASGVVPPPPGVLDSASNTFIWTSDSTWQMQYFGAYLYSMAGFIQGVWSVYPTIDFGINFSEKHYGLPTAFLSELKRICNIDVQNRAFIGADIYSDVEAATDISGTYIPKTGANANGTAQSLQADGRLKYFFLDKGLAKEGWIVEQGYNIAKGSLWPDATSFFKNTTLVYYRRPGISGIYMYEALNETKTRAGGSLAELNFGIDQNKATLDMFRMELLGLPPIP